MMWIPKKKKKKTYYKLREYELSTRISKYQTYSFIYLNLELLKLMYQIL